MIPYFYSLVNAIPYSTDYLIDLSKIKIIKDIDQDNFVRKDNYAPTVLSPDFLAYLESLGIKIRKVVVWHWLCKNPHLAHVDSGPNGDTITAAINWVISKPSTQLNFYNISIRDPKVAFGDKLNNEEWHTENVGSYIPIIVNGLEPDAIWDTCEPHLINPTIPHMVVAKTPRITVSLQLQENIPFLDLVERFKTCTKIL